MISMFDIFQNTTRPNPDLIFRKNDANDIRLGEIVPKGIYAESEVVILGCPQDEGVLRNGGRVGAALAPEAIRRQFYKLTPFGISAKVFDLGDTFIKDSLEETHDLHTKIVEQVLRDGKKIIVLGGGNDISYADGCAMGNVFGSDKWLGINIDAHFDVRADQPRNSGTPYRQLLEEKSITPENFYEIAFQPQANSPVYHKYLQNCGVNLTSLDEFYNSKFEAQIKNKISNAEAAIFWGFDADSVQSSDAPGTSAPSPTGLAAREFCDLAKFAGSLPQTKIIEFTEVNPNYDIDSRTAKLIATAMHTCLSTIKKS